jgi:predicted transcriptional regulator
MTKPNRRTYQIGEKSFVIDHEMFGETEEEFWASVEASHRDYQETGLHLTHDEVVEWMEKRLRGERVPMPEPHT